MARFTIVKLQAKAGWAIFDRQINSTVVGTRCTTRKECFEAAAELGIEIGK